MEKTQKNKVLKDIPIGMMSFIWKMKQKRRYKLLKINRLTLQYYGNMDDINICYYLKLPFQKPPLKF